MTERLEEMGSVDSIRQKAHHAGQAFRVKRRNELYAAHRQNLEEVEEEIKVHYINSVFIWLKYHLARVFSLKF